MKNYHNREIKVAVMKVANDWSNHGLSKSLPQIQLYLLKKIQIQHKYKYIHNINSIKYTEVMMLKVGEGC